jgi:PAS domain S-box-containing protein
MFRRLKTLGTLQTRGARCCMATDPFGPECGGALALPSRDVDDATRMLTSSSHVPYDRGFTVSSIRHNRDGVSLDNSAILLPATEHTRRPAWVRFGAAILFVILGLTARYALNFAFGPTALPFMFFFPAIAAAAWFGALGPGILAIILSALAANWFFSEPIHEFSLGDSLAVAVISSFVVSAGFIVGAIEVMHRSRAHLLTEIAERKRVETELANSRELLATTLSSIGDGMIATDAQGRVTSVNSEAERLTGWTNHEAANLPLVAVWRVVNEQTRQAVDNPVNKVLRLGSVVSTPNYTVLVARDGRETPIHASAAPLRRPGKPMSGVVLVFRDVSEQRKADQDRFRLVAIVENSADAIFSYALDGTIQSWNAGAQHLFSYRPDEIIGESVTVLVPLEHRAEEKRMMDQIRQGRPVQLLETARVAKDGRRIPVSVSISPLINSDGRVIGASKIVHPIDGLVPAR